MLLKLGMLGGRADGGSCALAYAPVATAEPVWPVAGAEVARATIDDLEAQGYDVQINWVSGIPMVPLVPMQSHRESTTPTTRRPARTHSPPFTSTSRVQTQTTTGAGSVSASVSVSDRDSDSGQREDDRIRVAGCECPWTPGWGFVVSMVPSCRVASTLNVTVPGATPSLLHFVPSGRSTTNLQSPFHGWASAVQPVLSAIRAQSGPHGVTTQVEVHTGPIRDEGAAEIVGPGGACETDGGAGEDGGSLQDLR